MKSLKQYDDYAERFQLDSYDPFPMKLGDSRTVDDFIFFSEKRTETVNSYKNWNRDFYWLCIKHIPTGEQREFSINSYYSNSPRRLDSYFKRLRKSISARKLLWGLNKTNKFHRNKQTIMTDQFFSYRPNKYSFKHYLNDYEERTLPRTYEINFSELDRSDFFISELEKTIKKDRKQWKEEKQNKQETLETMEDIARTSDLVKILPKLEKLHRELENFTNKGMNYNKKDASDLEDAFQAIKHHRYFWRDLKKHGN